jgi:hypothetical protein
LFLRIFLKEAERSVSSSFPNSQLSVTDLHGKNAGLRHRKAKLKTESNSSELIAEPKVLLFTLIAEQALCIDLCALKLYFSTLYFFRIPATA